MAPRDLAPSSLGFRYPENRDAPNKSGDLWLKDKQRYDGAEGLWRIHDDLYDLTDFVDVHPGGSSWLELTKGTDITEAFEAHHIFTRAEAMLKKFHVRSAATKRHAPYTFKENGFFKTLRRNAREVLKDIPRKDAWRTNLMIDSLLVLTFVFAIMSCKYASFGLSMVAGLFLTFTTIAAHNYFHQKDNFRMYYFDLSFLSSRDWRISHALSHHLLTNTIYDLEISLFEPDLEFLPTANKRFISVLKAPLTWLLLFHNSFYGRIVMTKFEDLSKTNLIPFSLPLAMYVFGGQTIFSTFIFWNVTILASSFVFAFIGLNAAHHHPDIFHDGDAVREDMDWGLHQLDAVMDRTEVHKSHFLSLISFGDHALHHMFPTLDVGTIQHLHPVFDKTCKDFGIDLRLTSQVELVKGHFQQLLRDEPNKNVTDLLKYTKQ